VDAVEQRPHLVAAERDRLIDALFVPARRHAGGEERLGLGRKVQRVAMPRREERLDAEPVARREHQAPAGVPQDECELAAQLMQALDAVILEQVERDLAVGSGPEAVASSLELALDRLVAVELPVDDDPRLLVLAHDRLVAGREVDDAEARMTEPDASVVGHPLAPAVGPSVTKGAGGARQRLGINGLRSREDSDDSTHVSPPCSPGRTRGYASTTVGSPLRQAECRQRAVGDRLEGNWP